MVSVVGKGGVLLRQVRLRETNASEPLMKCRKAQDDVETGNHTWYPASKGWESAC